VHYPLVGVETISWLSSTLSLLGMPFTDGVSDVAFHVAALLCFGGLPFPHFFTSPISGGELSVCYLFLILANSANRSVAKGADETLACKQSACELTLEIPLLKLALPNCVTLRASTCLAPDFANDD
jgi:hypothetical protein